MDHPSTFFIRPSFNMSVDVDSLTGERPRYRIADPVTGEYLPDNGTIMPRSSFWLRRLRDKDVEVLEEATFKAEDETSETPQSEAQNQVEKQPRQKTKDKS